MLEKWFLPLIPTLLNESCHLAREMIPPFVGSNITQRKLSFKDNFLWLHMMSNLQNHTASGCTPQISRLLEGNLKRILHRTSDTTNERRTWRIFSPNTCSGPIGCRPVVRFGIHLAGLGDSPAAARRYPSRAATTCSLSTSSGTDRPLLSMQGKDQWTQTSHNLVQGRGSHTRKFFTQRY